MPTIPYHDLRRRAIALRKLVLGTIAIAGVGHTGGSLSCLDILVALYHGKVLRIDPRDPTRADRDRYIQSKGHAVEALYAVLADRGFFPAEELSTLCRFRSRLIGHPTREVPGIEANTGALGHGLPIAAGTALAAKLDGTGFRVFTLLGDGELAEGSNWEAAMWAAHRQLDNLVAIIDANRLQITGRPSEVCSHDPLAVKWSAFGWTVREVDGHDVTQLMPALQSIPAQRGRPTVVIAHTVKGKGVSYMEDRKAWHHGVPTPDQLAIALSELDAAALALGAA